MWSQTIPQLLAGLLLSSSLIDASAAKAKGGQKIKAGKTITFQATTQGFTNFYISHNGTTVVLNDIPATSTAAQWLVTAPLDTAAGKGCVSFKSVDTPGSYIRNYAFALLLQPTDGSAQFNSDATYCVKKGNAGKGTKSFQSDDYPTRYFRHYAEVLYIATNGGTQNYDTTNSYAADTSFKIGFVKHRKGGKRSVDEEVMDEVMDVEE